MNGDALQRTIATGEAHYWSRSRQCLWRKGETSGLVQETVELRVDDDQDAIWLRVKVAGSGPVVMWATVPASTERLSAAALPVYPPGSCSPSRVSPSIRRDVYGDAPNPTRL